MTSIYEESLGYEIAFAYRDVPAEVDALIRLSGVAAPTAVVELAAGPAEHAIECARRGMRASTVDLSRSMCERAAQNAAAAGVSLDVVNTDMRSFTLAEPVDLAFCMISSISHMVTLDDMVAHLGAVHDALTAGGGYVIEGTHPGDYIGEKTVQSDWESERDGISVHLAWGRDEDVMDPVTQLTDVHVTLRVTGADGVERTYESVEQDRFWTAVEMQAAARLAGLTVTGQYGDFDGRPLAAEGAWRMITVMRRPA